MAENYNKKIKNQVQNITKKYFLQNISHATAFFNGFRHKTGNPYR